MRRQIQKRSTEHSGGPPWKSGVGTATGEGPGASQTSLRMRIIVSEDLFYFTLECVGAAVFWKLSSIK